MFVSVLYEKNHFFKIIIILNVLSVFVLSFKNN